MRLRQLCMACSLTTHCKSAVCVSAWRDAIFDTGTGGASRRCPAPTDSYSAAKHAVVCRKLKLCLTIIVELTLEAKLWHSAFPTVTRKGKWMFGSGFQYKNLISTETEFLILYQGDENTSSYSGD